KPLAAIFLLLCFFSCRDDNVNAETSFGVFRVIDDNTVEMNGEIGSSTLDDFNDLIDSYPNINKINIDEVPGSDDDAVNLQVAAKVHQLNIATHLIDEGLIASGGTDFFLAGTTRTKGVNTKIGVHSWAGEDNNGNQITATDFPVGDMEHQSYINYYVSVGFTQQQAEDFYYFTINAAPAESIHYMTEAEIEEYNILKP
ncbi:MAG: alpha/beta hydrolase, partial [Bacteroidota bacterium]